MKASVGAAPVHMNTLDVLVIGAGQAGLAAGYHLRSTGLRYALLERHARIGDSWRLRYDSLALFTPRSYSALAGLALSSDPDEFPGKDEIADYLERYAQQFALPVRLDAGVVSLEQMDDRFRATIVDGSIVDARAVVIASGAFQTPAIPALASSFSAEVTQLTPDAYRNPTSVPLGAALVVGDGATGRHIARELAATHRVLLAGGRPRRLTPDRILGRSTFLVAGPPRSASSFAKQPDRPLAPRARSVSRPGPRPPAPACRWCSDHPSPNWSRWCDGRVCRRQLP